MEFDRKSSGRLYSITYTDPVLNWFLGAVKVSLILSLWIAFWNFDLFQILSETIDMIGMADVIYILSENASILPFAFIMRLNISDFPNF